MKDGRGNCVAGVCFEIFAFCDYGFCNIALLLKRVYFEFLNLSFVCDLL
jgi:hypothetical protein